jgi:NAD+ kinase
MKVKKALVVYKRSLLEREKDKVENLLPEAKKRLLKSDVENRKSIHFIFYELVKRKLDFDLLGREESIDEKNYDLIIIVGGDGTFFLASHFVKKRPVMLVNSDPENSLGIFACADRSGFARKLEAYLDGKLKITLLNRLELLIDSKGLDVLVINDLLFSNTSPVIMSRYYLEVDGKREFQESSGIWISTAAGSTAAIYSAGGKIIDINSKEMQYVVREPWAIEKRSYKLLKGLAKKRITITPFLMGMAIWIDGAELFYEIKPGQKLTIRPSSCPLKLIGFDDKKRRRFFK